MGCDIEPISNHQLNTMSLAALAKDLSKRLQINVAYGYHDLYGLGKYYNNLTSEDFIVIGQEGNYADASTYTLRDDDYLERELYKLHGRDFFKSEAYLEHYDLKRITDKEIDDIIGRFDTYIYELISTSDSSVDLRVYKECLDCGFYYYSRWWAFCRAVMEWQYVDKDALNKYRRNMMEVVKKTGGHKLYYLNDQATITGEIEGVYYNQMTWHEMENHLHKSKDNVLVSISEYNLNADYRKSFEGYNQNDLMFVDDFRDL